MEIQNNLSELTDEALAEYAVSLRAAIEQILAGEVQTEEQLAEAESYATALDVTATEQTTRSQAAADRTTRTAALRDRFSTADEVVVEVVEEVVEEPVAVVETPPATAASAVRTIAAQAVRPRAPQAATQGAIRILSQPDVPNFATGQALDMEQVGQALVNRMSAFGTPSGDGKTESLQHFGVAQFRLDFPEDLTIKAHDNDMAVLRHAGDEKRLEGNSLTASGGWCAPSELLYDLCGNTGTAEGILSLPEVVANRGGINHTTGPDFSAIYTNVGFSQTEAQAISGTTKTCYEVPCPSFTDTRLDIQGLCIKAPILTNAGYPELVQEYLTGGMIAHQHKINAKMLTAMATAAGTARVPGGALGAVSTDTFEALTIYASHLRQKYRMGLTETLEVVLPYYVLDILRADMSRRNGISATDPITDQIIMAEFAARHLQVSWVYDWQDQTLTADIWPATFQAVMYPAGTFIKATKDVISLNAVYDAASLAVNIYTAMFFEQGVALVKMCNEATLVTITNCTAGLTGSASLDCS